MRLRRFTKISSSGKKFFLWPVVISVFVIALVFVFRLFEIKKIAVIGDDETFPIVGLSDFGKKNLLFFDIDDAKKKLIGKNPFVFSIKMEKHYPNLLVINLTKEKPSAMIGTDNGFLYLSAAGKIIYKKKEADNRLPTMNFYQKIYYAEYQSGQKIDYQEILSGLQLIGKFNDLGLKVDAVDISGIHMVAFSVDGKKIIFSLEKELSGQAYQLETIIRQFRIEGKDFSRLDLRFDKPVIQF